MGEIPVTPITGVWARRVSNTDPYPTFALGATLEDGSELRLGTYDLFTTTRAHITGEGIRAALQRREEAP